MTEQSPLIYSALAEVMRSLTGVAKRDRNTHQNFNFRGIDAVMNAVGPVLREHGVIVVPNVVDVQYRNVTTTGGKPSTACMVRVDYIFYAEDGSSVVSTVAGEAWDTGDKATPKAMSVAFRTALLQGLCLPTDEPDPDSETYEQAREPKADGADIKALSDGFRERGMSGDEGRDARLALFADVLGRQTNGGDLTKAEAAKVIAHLKGMGPTAEQEKMLSESLGATPINGGSAEAQPGEDPTTAGA